jgi:hypothetical protein
MSVNEKNTRVSVSPYQEALDTVNEVIAGIQESKNATHVSAARVEANRRNALLSTGPKTDAGKQASSRNAIKHGFYTSTLLLPEEDHTQFEALCDRFLDEYRPEGLEETDLVEEMVTLKWRLARLNLMEQGVFNWSRRWITTKDNPHPTAAAILMKVGDDREMLQSVHRISNLEARLKRDYRRAKDDLRRVQAERKESGQPEPEPAPVEQAQEPEPTPAAPPAPPPPPAAPKPAAKAETPVLVTPIRKNEPNIPPRVPGNPPQMGGSKEVK